ncbi:TetR/AcrR family transcriptional regulator [Luteipulveratus mongoliensis]|uniref:TetR family transcriptional regulator n=1 Tax=Luteipulveratus mongoliensis TaxID=571913 RepID=A0A0K1JDG0_9MICO|nr:TetR/AcrR family transcriptional regulator [Luteipulveratus mongoliensis]AKU14737.1 TetR family transcriptional regulator [Luteipulveratus mongoliensis]
MSGTSPAGPRERLLVAGQQLFYARGASVGVDALLKDANVARRSLYEHFGGKDGLIEAVLRRAAEEDLAWYESALAAEAEPRDRLLGLFDRLDELVSNPDFRGCRYFATDLALAEPDHPAHAETASFRQRLRSLLVRELKATGHDRPEGAAEQLHLLIEGTLVMGATQDGRHPGHAARDLAAAILD